MFPAMNTAQQQVLDKVIELLSEHFDHAVVAVGLFLWRVALRSASEPRFSLGVGPSQIVAAGRF